jgi:glycerophosphoryl diester phosphodiesterase
VLICLDYDGTYTEDNELWDIFIYAAKAAGHTVICATMRDEKTEGAEVKRALEKKVSQIFFTNRLAKQPWLNERGIKPDVWIDDSPFWLLNDAAG